MDEKQLETTKILELLNSIQSSDTSIAEKSSSRQKFSHYANTITDLKNSNTKTTPTTGTVLQSSLKTTGNSLTTQQHSNLTITTTTTPQPKPLSEEERKTIDKMQVIYNFVFLILKFSKYA